MNPIYKVAIYGIVTVGLFSCNSKTNTESRIDFAKYYDSAGLKGSFLLYDPQENKYMVYNDSMAKKSHTPASTFKICNTIIGLETGVIKDENHMLAWDSVQHPNPNWNQDQNLKTAFQNSTVWYYQELARRVGGQQMKQMLNRLQYGNADTSGGIDLFWLEGNLRISAYQQIDFLRRLYENKLPVSHRSMNITKNIMLAEDTLGYTIRAKTGWGTQNHTEIGWYVGWIETNKKVYYFCNMVQMPDTVSQYNQFNNARKSITHQILRQLNLLPES